jgi:C-terminal processing protease CtpA/Prc
MAAWHPTPAERAGVKIGDRILAVNQLNTHQMSLDELSRHIHGSPGTKVSLIIDSGGHKRSVPMTIRCLLCPKDNPLGKSQ